MKLQKVIALCKKKKVMRLFDRIVGAEHDDDGVLCDGCEPYTLQYISDGGAVYPLEGLPELDFDTLFTLYDISEADAEKLSFNRSEFPEGVDIGDVAVGERQLEKPNIAITAGGTDLLPSESDHRQGSRREKGRGKLHAHQHVDGKEDGQFPRLHQRQGVRTELW